MKSADVVLFYHDTSEQTVSRLRGYLKTVQVVKPADHLVRQAINSLPRGKIRVSRLIHRLRRKLISQHHLYLLTGIYHVHFARYFWAADYCDRVDIRQYKRVMLCDSRDVIVQSDVFDKVDDISFWTGREDAHLIQRGFPTTMERVYCKRFRMNGLLVQAYPLALERL